jgi:hypothetical protein|tara:strand:+ start:11834 stop:12073 length:240 start_codon:yes stop_codon:yes gene_type:complete
MTNLYLDVAQTEAPELDINGMTNIPDVITMIRETIQDKDLDSAEDYVDQLGDYLAKRDSHILQTANINTKNIIEEMYNV